MKQLIDDIYQLQQMLHAVYDAEDLIPHAYDIDDNAQIIEYYHRVAQHKKLIESAKQHYQAMQAYGDHDLYLKLADPKAKQLYAQMRLHMTNLR